jgi:hypothetical protein
VNTQDADAMKDFLMSHPRYSTMDSWNRVTSYANNIKLHRFVRPSDIPDDVWWEMYTLDDWQTELSFLLREFGADHGWLWQARINGRSGGYVVLYFGGQKPSGYKSYCTACGQKNFRTTEETGVKCGKCSNLTRINFTKPPVETYTTPGIGIDQDQDFDGWSMDSLQERVKLVQDFDRLADDILAAYIGMCSNHVIEEEEVTVIKKVRVLKERTEP